MGETELLAECIDVIVVTSYLYNWLFGENKILGRFKQKAKIHFTDPTVFDGVAGYLDICVTTIKTWHILPRGVLDDVLKRNIDPEAPKLPEIHHDSSTSGVSHSCGAI